MGGQPARPKALSEWTVAELRLEIGALQAELLRRVFGGPRDSFTGEFKSGPRLMAEACLDSPQAAEAGPGVRPWQPAPEGVRRLLELLAGAPESGAGSSADGAPPGTARLAPPDTEASRHFAM